MVRLSWMYYDEALTHEQIAKRLRISRVSVTRLLQKARREGIVQIKITKPLPLHHQLESRLERTFGPKRAIVTKTHDSLEDTLDAVGCAGAEHLNAVLFRNCRVGIAWSRTVGRMAPFLQAPKPQVKCVVNELAGSLLHHSHPYSISWEIARVLSAPLEVLPAPVVVQNRAARDAMLKEAAVKSALVHATQCDLAFLGLGDVSPDGTLVRTGFATPEQMIAMKNHGAVCDLLMRFYDVSGHQIPSPFDSCIISITPEELGHIPYKVVLAAGSTKVEPLLGALSGKLCECVITDAKTAEKVLQHVPAQ